MVVALQRGGEFKRLYPFTGSWFSVKDKGGIKDLKPSSKMLIFANNCQFGSRFCFRPDEADAFLVNTHPKCSPGARMEP